jgi:hypothetical protein
MDFLSAEWKVRVHETVSIGSGWERKIAIRISNQGSVVRQREWATRGESFAKSPKMKYRYGNTFL